MKYVIIFFVLFFSVILHEIAHGYVALLFGDPTAKNLNRLTLNPIPHVDIIGTILLPGAFFLSQAGFMIGWAKPVPINPRYFKNPIKDMMWVSLAGPLTNVSIAVIGSLLLRATVLIPAGLSFKGFIIVFLIYAVRINIFLAIFNLLPIPPLDGSKVVFNFLPYEWQFKFQKFEPFGFVVIFLLAYFGFLGILLNLIAKPVIAVLFVGL